MFSRIAGAVLEKSWIAHIERAAARAAAARVSGLLTRLVAGEVHDPNLFGILTGFFEALTTLPEDAYDAAEALAALRVLAVLGLDAGEIPGGASDFTPAVLAPVRAARASYIARINHGIDASGL